VRSAPSQAPPVARRPPGQLALGILALLGAVALLVYGVVVALGGGRGAPADRPGNAAAAPPALARFDLPSGWEDRSRDLAGQVAGARPDFVLLGPVGNGFRSNLNVVRQPAGKDTPPLDDLVKIVSDKVKADLSAELVGRPRPLTLGGVPAVAYDYRYQADGRRLQGRQIVAERAGTVVFVNFTADQDAFKQHAEALDVVTRSWRWS
jgi:hypothetical protein